FNLIPSDVNRPLAHITHKLDYDQLTSDAAQVLETLAKVEREVQSQEGRWYLARMVPYRTLEDKIDGVTLTFVDITERKESAPQRMATMDSNVARTNGQLLDQAIWAALDGTVVPALFARKLTGDALRVWLPDCATGELAYALASLLHSYVRQRDHPPKLQI